jgi:hypothetical protein
VDQRRPFGKVSDEPEQSQQHEEEDEQDQALPRSGLWLRAIDPVKFHRRVPQPFQPLHQGAHPRLSSTGAGFASRSARGLRQRGGFGVLGGLGRGFIQISVIADNPRQHILAHRHFG